MASFSRWLKQRLPFRKRVSTLSAAARRSFYISLALHGLLVVAALGVVIGHVFLNRESTFKGEPPPQKFYEPRKLEHRVKVSKQQRSSSRPAMAPRLMSSKVTQGLALPEIKASAKALKTAFQPTFKSVTGSGVGVGLGTGYGLAGFGMGVSQFDFFGIRGKGERIAILLDVSVSMVKDPNSKDPFAPPTSRDELGYMAVKSRIDKVIDALGEGTLFNVIAFATSASEFETNLVVATRDNKTRAKGWVQPFNSHGNYGLSSGNAPTSDKGLAGADAGRDCTRLDLAISAAFLMGADTILIISDGLPRVTKVLTAEAYQSHNAMVQKWYADNAGRIAAFQAEAAAAPAEAGGGGEKVWIPDTPARPPRKSFQEGVPDDPGHAAVPGHWQVIAHNAHPRGPQPPAMPPPGLWTLSDFIEHIRLLYTHLYEPKGQKMPVIHVIGYRIDDEGSGFMKGLATRYKGQYRRVAKISD